MRTALDASYGGTTDCIGGCHLPVDSGLPLCDECLAKLYRLSALPCSDCGEMPDECICSGIKVITLFAYKGQLARTLIYGIKRNMTRDNARFWAGMLKTKLELLHKTHFDAVTAVPSRKKARLRYGYGHAEMLALELARQLGLPYVDMLYRTDNKQQKLLSASQRKRNISNSYRYLDGSVIDPKTRQPYRHVLLLDDVTTTGDTMKSCRLIIKKQGVNNVTCITVAKTVIK